MFKGNEPIKTSVIGDVFYASLGNAVNGDNWSGMIVEDPFQMAKGALAISLDGVAHSKVSSAGKTYPVEGSSVEQSLNGVVAQLEADNEPVCSIDFEQHEEGIVAFKNAIGDVEVPAIAKTKYLNPDLHIDDKQYLESLAYLTAIADNFANLQKSCNFMNIRLSIEPVVKAHGENSEAVSEALDLFYSVAKQLNDGAQKSSNNGALVGVIVNKAESNSRRKRDAVVVAQPDPKVSTYIAFVVLIPHSLILYMSFQNPYNLAEYYSEDYPVIFNIILWFMVVFGFALLAICYAIGSMDPGRDSIIYRMTSTRMKKDN